MKKILILLIFIPFALAAQNNTRDNLHQHIIMSVLQQINQYESASSFASEEKITQFQNLFVNLDTEIVNDIPPLASYNDNISVENYINQTRKYYQAVGVDVKINNISKINFVNDEIATLSVNITKYVSGENARHKIIVKEFYEGKMQEFEEYVEYEDDFNLELKFEYNNGSVLISEISLAEPKGLLLVVSPHWKTWSNKKDLNAIDEMKLIIDGKEIQLGGYFYSIKDINENTKITFKSNDKTLIGTKNITLKTYEKTSLSSGLLHKLDFTKTKGDARIFGLTRTSISLNSNQYNATIEDNSSFSFGADLSYNLDDVFWKTTEAKRKQWGSVYVKAGVVRDDFDYTLGIPSFSYSYDDIDSDGANYERTVTLTNYQETQKVDMQTIFVQGEVRLKSPKFFPDWLQEAGVSLAGGLGQVTINSATYGSSADATFSGYYDDLWGLTIAENGVYNFGEFSGNNNLQTSEGTELVFNNSVQTILLNASVFYNINDRVFIDAGIMYTDYQSNIFEIGSERITHEKGQQPHELNTINNLIDVNMNSLGFKLALCVKF